MDKLAITMRRCNGGCGRSLPLDAEHFHRSPVPSHGGFMYGCKPCERERARWRNMLRLYGLTKDDPARLERLAAYLRLHQIPDLEDA